MCFHPILYGKLLTSGVLQCGNTYYVFPSHFVWEVTHLRCALMWYYILCVPIPFCMGGYSLQVCFSVVLHSMCSHPTLHYATHLMCASIWYYILSIIPFFIGILSSYVHLYGTTYFVPPYTEGLGDSLRNLWSPDVL